MDVMEKLVELLCRVQKMGIIYRESKINDGCHAIEQVRNDEVASCFEKVHDQ